jgi:predicted N-acetyltransferase YhbS
MDFVMRVEQKGDWQAVENLTREAFWNVHEPGCSEHLLMRRLRSSPAFIKELSITATVDGEIVGHIAYTRAAVISPQGVRHEVLCFGPLSVLPARQNRGIGSALVEQTKDLARKMGFGAILIYGDPLYYERLGFVKAECFDIYAPDGMYADALQACELNEGALSGISGAFHEDAVFDAAQEDVEAFDQSFPPKAKGFLPSQARFAEVVSMRRPRQVKPL